MNASTDNEAQRVRLLGLDRQALERQCVEWGQKPFRARQLLRWVHQRGVADFDAMTDLAQDFRRVLAERACIEAPAVLADHESADGTRRASRATCAPTRSSRRCGMRSARWSARTTLASRTTTLAGRTTTLAGRTTTHAS